MILTREILPDITIFKLNRKDWIFAKTNPQICIILFYCAYKEILPRRYKLAFFYNRTKIKIIIIFCCTLMALMRAHMKKLNLFAPTALISLALVFLIIAKSFYTVQPGFAALQLRFGRIVSAITQAGFYFKLPSIDHIIPIDMRIAKAEIETTALSRDLQSVSLGMAVNYRIIDPLKLYQEIGTTFGEVIIDPFTQESVKAVVAKFTAEDLIQSRHEAKEKVINELRARLETRYILLVDFNFTHVDFSHEFIKAVEDKQIAEQSAKTAKNLTEKVKEEALQTKTRAEAEAFALQVKKAEVTPELIALKQVETQLKAIEKWDGVLPRVTSSSIPFLSLTEEKTKT
jgi:regulator of protease activity HflC (stomatin/prohibitin superfamily)